MKKASLLCGIYFLPVLLGGCSSAWIVSQQSRGGTIGYSGYESYIEGQKKIDRLIHCPNHLITGDEKKTSSYIFRTTQMGYDHMTASAADPMYEQRESAADDAVKEPIKSEVRKEVWREMTYKCL